MQKVKHFMPNSVDSLSYYLDKVDYSQLSDSSKYLYRRGAYARYASIGPYEKFIEAHNDQIRDFPSNSEDEQIRMNLVLQKFKILYGKKQEVDSLFRFQKNPNQNRKLERLIWTNKSFYALYSNNRNNLDSLQNKFDELPDDQVSYYLNFALTLSKLQLSNGNFNKSAAIAYKLLRSVDKSNIDEYFRAQQLISALLARNAGNEKAALDYYIKTDSLFSKNSNLLEIQINYKDLIPFLIRNGKFKLAKEKAGNMLINGQKMNSQMWINKAIILNGIINTYQSNFALARSSFDLISFEDDQFTGNHHLLKYANLIYKSTTKTEFTNEEIELLSIHPNEFFSISDIEEIINLNPEYEPFALIKKQINTKIGERDAILNSIAYFESQPKETIDAPETEPKYSILVYVLFGLLLSIAMMFLIYLIKNNKIANDQDAKQISTATDLNVSKLKEDFSTLSKTDLKYIKLFLSDKPRGEIANDLNISSGSVTKAKYRIKQKMELPKESDLEEFIRSNY